MRTQPLQNAGINKKLDLRQMLQAYNLKFDFKRIKRPLHE